MIESLAHAFELSVNGVRIGDLWTVAKQVSEESENNA